MFKRLKFEYLAAFEATDEETGEVYTDYEPRTKIIPVMAVRVEQITEASTVIGDILNKVKSDEQILENLKVQFGLVSEEFIDKETGALIGEMKERALENWAQTLEFLLKELPGEVMDLLSVISNIDREELNALTTTQLFELLEAVVEVNDVDQLTEAAKSFFTALTKKTSKAIKTAQSKEELKAVPAKATAKRNTSARK